MIESHDWLKLNINRVVGATIIQTMNRRKE